MDDAERLNEIAIRIAHYLQAEQLYGNRWGEGAASTILKDRLEHDGLVIDGAQLTIRGGSLVAWAGEASDPNHGHLVEITLGEA